MISRILECFAAHYYECNPQFLVDPDACFLLAFSTVLLNVDLHNPSVRVLPPSCALPLESSSFDFLLELIWESPPPIQEKMTQDQFIFSLRGTNGEGDPPREVLVEIYTSIQANEIKVDRALIQECTSSR